MQAIGGGIAVSRACLVPNLLSTENKMKILASDPIVSHGESLDLMSTKMDRSKFTGSGFDGIKIDLELNGVVEDFYNRGQMVTL